MNRSPGNSTNRCLPAESAPDQRLAVEQGGVGGEPALRAADPGTVVRRTRRRGRRRADGGCAPQASWSERGVGQRRQLAGRLVVREHPDAAYVPRLAGEVGAQEDPDEPGHLRDRVHPAADREHVGVVVLAGQGRGLVAPGQRRADALDLVGRDLLAVAGAADHHAEAALVGDDALGRPEAEDRVVVLGVVDERPVVDRLVTLLAQPPDQVVLQLEAGVVGSQVDAHGVKASGPSARRGRPAIAAASRKSTRSSGTVTR